MSTYLTIRMIGEEILARLHNTLAFTATLPVRYDEKFAKRGAKIGETFNARLPVAHEVQNGDTFIPQDTTERSVQIVLNQRKHIGFDYDQRDRTLSMDNFMQRYMVDDINRLANTVDSFLLETAYKGVNDFVGVPGTAISALRTYATACQILDDQAVPRGRRHAVLSPSQHADLQDLTKGLFNPQASISNITTNGMFATKFYGIDKWLMDQNVYRHTVGALGTSGAPTSAFLMDETRTDDADTALSTTIHIDGCDSGTAILKAGDIISITDVYEVNPVSGQSTGRLKRFVVQADVTAVVLDADVVVRPAIRASGPYKTVSALPANNAPIFVFDKGTANYADIDGVQSPQGLLYHPEFMAFACVDLDMFMEGGGTHQERIMDPDTGLSILVTEWADARAFRAFMRMDLLYGAVVLQPNMAVRIVS